jgi:hypothetical protein
MIIWIMIKHIGSLIRDWFKNFGKKTGGILA